MASERPSDQFDETPGEWRATGRADPPSVHALTAILDRVNAGQQDAFSELVQRVYAELRGIAGGRLREAFHRPVEDLTQSPSVIVNEAVMALMRQRSAWKNTEHFFALATRLMMRIIVDYQRQRLAVKRGGGDRGARLDTLIMSDQDPPAPQADAGPLRPELLQAMERLLERRPRAAEVITLHAVCGLSMATVADLVGVSLPTATRDLRFARSWLQHELGEAAL